MALEVVWTKKAHGQLREVVDAISLDNPAAADRFAGELVARTRRLAQFPRSGAIYKRRRGFEVRQITYRKYRIFFRVRPRLKRVEILTVWHGAREDPPMPAR